ncbi:MAG: hypothetical protein ABI634_02660 [Acidobacteriota bacterium]
MKAILLALILIVPAPAAAQVDARAVLIAAGVAGGAYLAHKGDEAAHNHLTWSADHKKAADWLSTGIVAGAILTPCLNSQRASGLEVRGCLKREGLRIGLAVGAAETAKYFIHRDRPDGSDRKSFFSEHTAIACTAGLSSKKELLGLALCGAAGYLRVAGEKHWFTDILVGAGVGFGMSRIAR